MQSLCQRDSEPLAPPPVRIATGGQEVVDRVFQVTHPWELGQHLDPVGHRGLEAPGALREVPRPSDLQAEGAVGVAGDFEDVQVGFHPLALRLGVCGGFGLGSLLLAVSALTLEAVGPLAALCEAGVGECMRALGAPLVHPFSLLGRLVP